MFAGFKSSDGGVENKPKSIVPLFKHDETGMSAVGTAFYISSAGILVTAKHCIEEEGKVASEKGFSIIHWSLEEKDQYFQRSIIGGWSSPESDIAVLKVQPMHDTETGHPIPIQSVAVSIERPPPGAEAAPKNGMGLPQHPNRRQTADIIITAHSTCPAPAGLFFGVIDNLIFEKYL